jgi:DNA-binding CsgD family transcriptional regulator
MPAEADYLAYLDAVYAAPFEPDGFETAIARFADLIGGALAWLPTLSLTDTSGSGVLARIDPERQQTYFEYYSAINPYVLRGPRALHSPWPLLVLTEADYFTREELEATEYYNDFLKPQQIHSSVIVRLARSGGAETTLNIGRPPSLDAFTNDELRMAGRLQPHLIRALRVNQAMGERTALSGRLADVLDQSPHGVFLIDATGAVRHANREAERLLAEKHGLRIANGQLTGSGGAGKQLEALIRRAGSRDQRCGGSMLLATPGRARPLSLTVAPLTSERAAIAQGPWVLVCVTDLDAAVRLPEARLRQLYGLTGAEARVAMALFEGASPREIADAADVSFSTVRNQITRIYEKTQTHRQAELVRLMMRLLGVAGH